MKIDGSLGLDLSRAGSSAREVEAMGYDGAWGSETSHDPFFPILLGAEHTTDIELGTAIAVAFARNPMNMANIAWDLQAFSKGRFLLGLGSQVKPHITRRFSMPWSHPAARMREYVMAMRAIWDCWLNGTKLDFRGDFYSHTLMTPMFSPKREEIAPYGPPKVFVAGVGELMTEVAGEVCDGFLAHGFTTEKYLRDVTIPALERGRAKAGKTMENFELLVPAFIVTGGNEQQMAAARKGTTEQIAFYGSTPAYRNVLEVHGWGALQDELHALSLGGKWEQMGTLVSDDVLNAFAIVGEPEQVGSEMRRRFGDVAQRLSFYAPYATDPERWRPVIADLKRA